MPGALCLVPLARCLVPVAFLTIMSCAGPTQESGPPPLLTALPRTLSAAEARLIAASNDFAFGMLREARRTQAGENLFLSPTSASMALGMTLNGAAGTTLDSMRLALGLADTPLEEINQGYQRLIDLLLSLDPSVEFAIANSIWAREGVPFRSEFLAAGKTHFDAEIRTLDFGAPTALPAINDWVKEKTRDRIPTILDEIRNDEVMFLINAIFFKGRWRITFDPKETRDLPFHAGDGTTRMVPTMRLDPEPLRVASVNGNTIVELLYGNGAYAMVLALPAEGRTLADLADGLDGEQWAAWTGALAETRVGLTLPRFRLEYRRELKDDLSRLGMRVAFDPDRANFSRMWNATAENLFLTRVIQKSFVEVNEEGTTAAAATAVGVGVTSVPLTISFDRPFLFAIRERLSGTLLFVGQAVRL
jgi:serpin B